MSGGHFGWGHYWDDVDGQWGDAELNELYHDLFCGGEFSVRDYGGLFKSLDFYLSGDICESDYRGIVRRFKDKWFHRTPRNRIAFYEKRLQESCDRFKQELGLMSDQDDESIAS